MLGDYQDALTEYRSLQEDIRRRKGEAAARALLATTDPVIEGKSPSITSAYDSSAAASISGRLPLPQGDGNATENGAEGCTDRIDNEATLRKLENAVGGWVQLGLNLGCSQLLRSPSKIIDSSPILDTRPILVLKASELRRRLAYQTPRLRSKMEEIGGGGGAGGGGGSGSTSGSRKKKSLAPGERALQQGYG